MDYCAQNCLYRFDQALLGVLRNFPLRWAAWADVAARVSVRHAARAGERQATVRSIVRAALQPGAFRDRLTRDIFVSDDPNDRVGLLDYTLAKVVASEEADKKLERAIRKGEVRRFHDSDWIAEAEAEGRADRGPKRARLPSFAISWRESSRSTILLLPSSRAIRRGPRDQADANRASPKPEHIAAE